MTAAHTQRDARDASARDQRQGRENLEGEAKSGAKADAKKAASFWRKINEDWALNFSGMLAYNYLTAIAPILLALLAIAGLALSALSPASYQTFVNGLATRLPGSVGHSLVNGILATLRRDAGVLLIIAIVTAVFSGSRLFVTLDNLFAVVYRVDVRPLIRQNIMAILMMLLFVVLAPLSFFASSVPALFLRLVIPSGIQSNSVVLTIEGFIGGVIVGFILFGAIYYVVPNRKVSWATTWPGALTAAVLLNLFEVLFPIYQGLFLKNAGYGSVAGLLVVILIFLYYVGFITLLGAEVNSWMGGLRPLGATLPELYRQERREGVGNAPGAPRTGVSRTPPPRGAGGGGTAPRRPDVARPDTGRPDAGGPARAQGGAQRPAQALVASRRENAGAARHSSTHSSSHTGGVARTPATGKGGGVARAFATLATVGAMLGAGGALALRRIGHQSQPSM